MYSLRGVSHLFKADENEHTGIAKLLVENKGADMKLGNIYYAVYAQLLLKTDNKTSRIFPFALFIET